MPVLHNKISNQELQERLLTETEPRITISFYRYFTLNNPQRFRDDWYQKFTALQIFGRVYIATEGINAQISVLKNHFSAFRNMLYATHSQLDGIRLNIAIDDNRKSFWILRMKVRSRIVADGIKDSTFNPANVGMYLKAEEVNILSDDSNALFVDTQDLIQRIRHLYQ